MFGQIAVRPPGSERSPSLCPRDEVAHPDKLLKLVMSDSLNWRLYDVGDSMFHGAELEWSKVWRMDGRTIQSVCAYVLTESPGMFCDMKRIVDGDASYTYVVEWLMKCWDSPFMLSCPVMVCDDDWMRAFTWSYSAPQTYVSVDMFDAAIAVNDLVDMHAYTMCNGLTLFLAMCRLGLVGARHASMALASLVRQNGGVDELFQRVTERWEPVYYGHPSMHVCDNPVYYMYSGPNLPHPHVLECMDVPNIGSIAYVQPDVQALWASIQTVCMSAGNTAMLCAWPCVPDSVGANASVNPNIACLVNAVIRNRRTWAQWVKHRARIFHAVNQLLGENTHYRTEAWLFPTTYLYECAEEHSPMLCRSRIRQLWLWLMQQLDPDGCVVSAVVKRWMLKQHILNRLREEGQNMQMSIARVPVAFLMDMWNMYGERLDMYTVRTHRIICSTPQAILNVVPQAHALNAGSVAYAVSFLSAMKLLPPSSTYGVLLKNMHKRIAMRLMCLKAAFGGDGSLQQCRKLQGVDVHTVGQLLLHHLRENPAALLF